MEIDNTGHSPMTTLKGIWGEKRKGREEESRAAAKRWMDFWPKLGTGRLNKQLDMKVTVHLAIFWAHSVLAVYFKIC